MAISRTIALNAIIDRADILASQSAGLIRSAAMGVADGLWLMIPYNPDENPVVIGFRMGGKWYEGKQFTLAEGVQNLPVLRIFQQPAEKKK